MSFVNRTARDRPDGGGPANSACGVTMILVRLARSG